MPTIFTGAAPRYLSGQCGETPFLRIDIVTTFAFTSSLLWLARLLELRRDSSWSQTIAMNLAFAIIGVVLTTGIVDRLISTHEERRWSAIDRLLLKQIRVVQLEVLRAYAHALGVDQQLGHDFRGDEWFLSG